VDLKKKKAPERKEGEREGEEGFGVRSWGSNEEELRELSRFKGSRGRPYKASIRQNRDRVFLVPIAIIGGLKDNVFRRVLGLDKAGSVGHHR